ncbi:MAG TPA: MBL fold metallo-hydrolase [Actinomycetospora sp.]
MRVLADPNFLHRGQRAYLGHGLTSKRLTEPAWTPEELAPVDAVVLSHLHGDHWDRETRRRLPRTTPIVTTRHASRRLQTVHGFPRAIGLDTRLHGLPLAAVGLRRRGRTGRLARPGRPRRPRGHHLLVGVSTRSITWSRAGPPAARDGASRPG